MKRLLGLGISLAALGALIVPATAAAAPITVNDTGNGAANDGSCTLREAITAANGDSPSGGMAGECAAGSGADAIGFTGAVTPKITLTSALPAISTAMTITGPGAAALDVERQAAAPGNFRIFHVSADVPVTISGLTISGGRIVSTNTARAAGVWNQGDLNLSDVVIEQNTVELAATGAQSAQPMGAGVTSEGAGTSLLVSGSVIRTNTTTASATNLGGTATDNPLANVRGVGVFSGSPSTTIERTTISGNTATATAAAAALGTPSAFISGVGLSFNFAASVTATVTASTVSGNTGTATATGGTSPVASGFGGGIYGPAGDLLVLDRVTVTGNSASGANIEMGGVYAPSPTTITSSTIAGNSASGINAANLHVQGDAASTIRNTIVADPLGGGPNCSAFVISVVEDHNLDSSNSCGFTDTGDIQNVDPLLDPLGLEPNGGPTETIALQSGSPAIDAGVSSPGETSDQRGIPRPSDLAAVPNVADGSDFGAFEVRCTVASALAGCPSPPASSSPASAAPPASAPTGLRAAALKKCKKKKTKRAKKNCRKKARKLPV